MAKILVLYFSRADENYYPNGIHAVKVGAPSMGAIFRVKVPNRPAGGNG